MKKNICIKGWNLISYECFGKLKKNINIIDNSLYEIIGNSYTQINLEMELDPTKGYWIK